MMSNITVIEGQGEDKDTGLISSQVLTTVRGINFILTLFLAVLGVITNIINIRVFIKQGLAAESTTVSLFALAISDFGQCIFNVPPTLCFYIQYYGTIDHYLIKNCIVFTSITCIYPTTIFSRITCWITVYMSMERALCVLLPFKVKSLIRPKTTKKAMAVIFIFFFIFHIPYGVNNRIIWVRVAGTNDTWKVTNHETPLGKIFIRTNSLIGSTILTTVAIIIVVAATVVMLLRLKSSSKWRHAMSSTNAASAGSDVSTTKTSTSKMSAKERETVRMVSAVTSIYIICLTSSHVPGMAIVFIPGTSLSGVNANLFHTVYSFKHLFDVINSSGNMFLYLRMSSKYKDAFNILFQNGKK